MNRMLDGVDVGDDVTNGYPGRRPRCLPRYLDGR